MTRGISKKGNYSNNMKISGLKRKITPLTNKTDLPLGINPKAINSHRLPHLWGRDMSYKEKEPQKEKGSLSNSSFH